MISSTCALLLLLAALWPARARAEDDEVDRVATLKWGLLLGGGFFQANAPSDPPGSYTFLFGSAFSGGGFVGGLTSLVDLEAIPLGFGLDIMVSSTNLTGSAETSGARREVTLHETALRFLVPSVRVFAQLPFGQWELAVGTEFVVGLSTSAEERVEGMEPDERDLQTQSELGLFLVAQTGVTLEIDGFGPFDSVDFPLLIRLGWNPLAPRSTGDRFPNFESPQSPGAMVVAADWYVVALAGIRFGHSLR